MAYITIRIADDKVEELLNHKENEERYLKVKNDYFVFDIVSVDKEPTEKEKLAKENHALRRAWSPSRWGSLLIDIGGHVVNAYP